MNPMLNAFLTVSLVIGVIITTLILIVVLVNLWFIRLAHEKYTDAHRWKVVSWVVKTAVPILLRATVEIEGVEKLDLHEKAVVYANHRSLFDIVAFLQGVNRPHGYIAKEQIGKIYLIRRGMPLIKCEFLDRTDDRAAVKVILNAIKTVKSGHMMVVFPEGTRCIGLPLGMFKAGSFKVAQKAQAAIVPVTFYNTEILPTRWPRKLVFKVKVHDPIPYEDYAEMPTPDVAMMVEKIVKADLKD
jgi:1-acyl-sn-glycerol-3-phosphate acyltransferase